MNLINTLQTQSKENATKALFDILNSKAIDVLSSMQEDVTPSKRQSLVSEESNRKCGEYSNGRHKAVTYKNSDVGEYKVKFHTDNKHLPKADYFTDNKDDATNTAKHQIDNLHSKDGPSSMREEKLDEAFDVHVQDGRGYGEQPNKKDTDHILNGVKLYDGIFNGHSDKGSYFKFKKRGDAELFKSHAGRSPNKTMYADDVEEHV